MSKIKLPLFIFLFFPLIASASILNSEAKINQTGQNMIFRGGSNLDNFSLGDVIAISIQTILSIMGVIFLSLMIYGGYTWMMARGNEEEIKKAQGIIRMAVIGLVIIVMAYAITYFVFNALPSGGVGGGPGGSP